MIYYWVEVTIQCTSPWHNGMDWEEAKEMLQWKDAEESPLLTRTLPWGC